MPRIAALGPACALTLLLSSHASLATPDWEARVRGDIAAREYEVSVQSGTGCAPAGHEAERIAQAPNRAQNLRTCFTSDGVRVVPRKGDAHWTWGLALAGYGDDRDWQAASPAEPVANGNRVEYSRGPVTEWYVNEARGLEQGFTLGAPVTATPETLLRVGIAGDLRPAAGTGQVEFLSAAGVRVLVYANLVARDAAGTILPATMTLSGDAIEIRVATANALYPVTVDPLVLAAAWTAEPDQADAEFGQSVATAGDVNGDGYSDVIVGADLYDNGQPDEGRAFMYLGGATGLGLAPAWTAEPDVDGAGMGQSVATAGDVNGDGYSDVIVGAPTYTNGQDGEGRAFVYLGGATGLALTPAWSVEANLAGAHLGSSVATAGDVNGDGYSDVIVGAPNYGNGQANEGQALVYHGSSTGLATTSAWSVESNQAGALLGDAVATAGDFNRDGYSDILVALPHYTSGQANEGRVYGYRGGPTGLATSPAWAPESNLAGAQFGTSVATAGDVNGDGYSDVIVGAFGYTNVEAGEGRAFLYVGGGGGLSFSAVWTAESNQAGAEFGGSVSTAGDVNGDGYADVIVGASHYDNVQGNEGRAYTYLGGPGGLSLAPAAGWPVESNQAGAVLGTSVATAGDVNGDGYSDVIIGAPSYDNTEADEGRASVFLGSAAGLSAADATLESEQAQAHFGWSVAAAGDTDGDGYGDVIIGAPDYDNGQANEGAAFVFRGGPDGLRITEGWTAEPDQAGASFGSSVAGAGDVNGDGYADVIVGAYLFRNTIIGEGRASIYLGSALGLAGSAAWTVYGAQDFAQMGFSVATAGDVNGDGYSDVIVGAPNSGLAYVYLGGSNGPATVAAWIASGGQSGAQFGASVSTAGDVNGDGYSDVIVGAFLYGHGEADEGRAFVYRGGAAGLELTPSWFVESDQVEAHLGEAVASAGDVNGDGYADVIVGVPFYDDAEMDEGQARVYLGGPAGLATTPVWTAELDEANAWFGFAVATAGDVNGDGYSDVIVGAPDYDDILVNQGGAFVYYGSATGPSLIAPWNALSGQETAHLGRAVASAGDVDGDGYADVVVGAYGYTNGQAAEGRIYSYFGNSGPGIMKPLVRQLEVGDVPLAPLGASDSLYGVKLRANGRSPFGRSGLRIEYEITPIGALLDGSGLQHPQSWTDSGTGTVTLTVDPADLNPGVPYHWRLRIAYRPSTTPFQRHGPWLTLAANGLQETDFRTDNDADGDSYYDRMDNCTLVANPDQLDTDNDGYGNICDADFNNSGLVTAVDFQMLRSVINQPSTASALAAAADMNGSGLVTTVDFSLMRPRINTAPGPSGLRP